MIKKIGLFTDEEVLDYIQSGDLQQQNIAIRSIYIRYYGLIESLILRNNGSNEEVPDIFQDGIIVFFNKVKQKEFKFNSSIKTYLYSICRNLWLMRLRKAKKEIAIEEAHERIFISESHFDTLVLTEKKQLILNLINELGEQCQQLLKLFYYRRMRMEQIKNEMNFSNEQVAKNKKSKCMKTLRLKVMENEQYQIALR